MEAVALVRRVEGDEAVVELVRTPGGCGRCDEPGGCRSGILARPMAAGCREFRLANAIGARAGDEVVVEIRDGSAGRGALIAYGAPVAGLVLGAAGGVAALAGIHPDLAGAAGALAGLAVALAGVVWLRRRGRGGAAFRPVLTRRAAHR